MFPGFPGAPKAMPPCIPGVCHVVWGPASPLVPQPSATVANQVSIGELGGSRQPQRKEEVASKG